MKKLMLLLLALAVTGLQAQEKLPYEISHNIIFQMGNVDVDEDAVRVTSVLEDMGLTNGQIVAFDMPDNSFRVAEVSHLSKHLALEGALAYYGEAEYTVTGDLDGSSGDSGSTKKETHQVRARMSGFELFAVGKYPLFKDFVSAYVKAGGSYTRAEYDIDHDLPTAHPSEDTDHLSLSIGAGLYKVFDNGVVARLDYTSGEVDELGVSSVSVGLGFRFY